MKFALIYPNLDGTPQSLDMGVAYLATYIDQRTDHEVRVIDPTFHRRRWREYIEEELKKFKPDVVGISVVSLYFDYAKQIGRLVKAYRDIPIIVGGFHPIMNPDESAGVEVFDAICTGEGEYTLHDYLDALEGNRDLKKIKGIWFRKDGQLIKNEGREYNRDLDNLPTPDYDLFDDIDKYLYYLGRLYVIGTRGCPYSCSFCAESVLCEMNPGKRFRERDPVKYVSEIEYLYKKYKDRGMKIAHIYDAVFTFNTKWFKMWSSEYLRLGLDKQIKYSCFLKADKHNASEEKLDLLEKTGCLQVRIGIESGDDIIRSTIINKLGSDTNTVMDVIAKCNERGLAVKTYSIFGIPGDTKESIKKTFNYCNIPLIHIPLFFSYTPLPHTPLANKVLEMNKANTTDKMYSFHFSNGARNEGVPEYFVPMMILKSYVYYGSRLAWNMFLSNPATFFPVMLSRIFRGFFFGCPLLITSVYGLLNPVFWPNFSKRIKRRFKINVT